MGKVDTVLEQKVIQQRVGDSKKEPNGKTRNQKLCNRNERLKSRLDVAKKRIHKLEDVSIAIFHTEIQKENRMKRCNRAFKNWGHSQKV